MGWRMEKLTPEEVRRIYRERMVQDFPEAEIKELWIIERAMERKIYECYGVREEKEILAYAFFILDAWAGKKTCLLDYLAVHRDRRGTGVGSFCLGQCPEILEGADMLLVEVDNPEFAADAAERAVMERRMRFYESNGLRDTGVRVCLFSVEFVVLEMPQFGIHGKEAVGRAYEHLYASILPPGMYRRNVLARW